MVSSQLYAERKVDLRQVPTLRSELRSQRGLHYGDVSYEDKNYFEGDNKTISLEMKERMEQRTRGMTPFT